MLNSLVSFINAQHIPLRPEAWTVAAESAVFEKFKGVQSIYVRQGYAQPKAVDDFITGVIEYDIWVEARRGFPGVRFRIADDANWEEFYIRPHQSGNPDANQYTPVFNGVAGWQTYYGAPNAAAYNYKINDWNRIKLVIADDAMEVYINDMNQPLLFIPDLERQAISSPIQLYAGGPSGFRFANLSVERSSSVSLKNRKRSNQPVAEDLITQWEVSESFELNQFLQDNRFDFKKANGLSWKSLKVTSRGHVNLSEWALLNDKNNTSIARIALNSEKAQIKKLTYGFSDKVLIFVNGKIVHGGNDAFRTRDYRFLGTIGYFDDIYLDLKPGRNEIWFVVTEEMGGWAVKAKLQDLNAVEFVEY